MPTICFFNENCYFSCKAFALANKTVYGNIYAKCTISAAINNKYMLTMYTHISRCLVNVAIQEPVTNKHFLVQAFVLIYLHQPCTHSNLWADGLVGRWFSSNAHFIHLQKSGVFSLWQGFSTPQLSPNANISAMCANYLSRG